MTDACQVPQLAFPLRLAANGDFAVVEQDSLEDIAESVAVLLNTVIGEREELPEYGIPDVTFGIGGLGLDTTGIDDAIAEWEPRADVKIDVQLDSRDDMVNYVMAQVAANG